MPKKEELKKTTTSNKSFGYTKGTVNLNFTLRVDNSSELRDFKSLLQEAIKDIEAEISGMKN